MEKMLVQGDFPFLPEQIFISIVMRLPVKTLIRFQLVSKFWKNLVRSPYFIAVHLHHTSNQIPRSLFNMGGPLNLFGVDCAGTHELVYLWKPSFMSKLSGTRIINSCNGLICVRSDHDSDVSSLFIWNPATREVRCVPGVIEGDVDGVFYFGFGFSPFLNDYKIVKILMSDGNKRVEVYSLNTDTWREIEFGNAEIRRMSHDHASFNGSIFWVTEEMNGIVSFDLAREVFKFVPEPGSYIQSPYSRVVQLNQKLVLVGLTTWGIKYPGLTTRGRKYGYALHFWEMEEAEAVSDDKKWSSTKIDGRVRSAISNLDIPVLFYVESLVPIANINREELA
ncbi:hypothetical protein QN277_009883 [Acacia crassicarpa]|uniref:F-box domain-containing protein n=1 Tax=Acacia crassicarpa TaxID=499986 RepID=A0AAE1IQ62_9FABA|nr:hypothetical protein QN277_009883 [Acacia crassicarpa]